MINKCLEHRLGQSLRWLAYALLVVSLSACVSTTVVIDADDLSLADTSKTGVPIEGRGCGYQLFSLIPLGTNGRQWRAYRELRANARGKVLTDIQIEEHWSYQFVGNTLCTRMKAVGFPRLGAPPEQRAKGSSTEVLNQSRYRR